MSNQQDQLQTISSSIDDSSRTQTIRHTLQPKTQAGNKSPNRPRSQSYTQRPQQIILQPPIPEGDGEDDETTVNITNGTGNTIRTSFAKKPPSRSNSMTGVKAKIIEVKGYNNNGYINSGYDDQNNQQNFQRGYIDSTRSSAHESVQSLQVQREQYCCFSRWSPFERRLATSVGVLAGVIVALVIAVGLLARSNGVDEKFVWKP